MPSFYPRLGSAFLIFLCVGCLKAADSSTVTCGSGSSSQSIIPSGNSLDRYLQQSGSNADDNANRLRRVSGIGGYLAFQVAGSPVSSLTDSGDSQSPFNKALPTCVANFFDSDWAGKKELILWTSRNCINYAQMSGEFYVQFFGNVRNFKAKLIRFSWPQNLKAKISEIAQEATEAAQQKYQPFSYLDVHNFDHAIVSFQDAYSEESKNPIENSNAFPYVEKKVTEVTQAKKLAFQQEKDRNPFGYKLVSDFILLTEKQSLLRNIVAMKATASATNCSVSSAAGLCKAIEVDLRNEFVASEPLLASSGVLANAFKSIWSDPLIWAGNGDAASAALNKVAKQREAEFRRIFGFLENSFRNAGKKSAPVVEGAAPSTTGLAGSEVGVPADTGGLLGQDLINFAFLHGDFEILNPKGQRTLSSAYQAIPFSFLLESEARTVAANTSEGKPQGTPQQNHLRIASLAPEGDVSAATGIIFRDPARFEPRDEGTMLTLFGVAPVGFVSFPGVRFGKHPNAAPKGLDSSSANETYSSGPCP